MLSERLLRIQEASETSSTSGAEAGSSVSFRSELRELSIASEKQSSSRPDPQLELEHEGYLYEVASFKQVCCLAFVLTCIIITIILLGLCNSFPCTLH